MTVLCWNCRGAASKGFTPLLRDMKMEFFFSFLILLETHVSGRRAANIVKRFGFDGCFCRRRPDMQEVYGVCGIKASGMRWS